MDEMQDGTVVTIAMGLPQAMILGTALGLFISTSTDDVEDNPCETPEDEEYMLESLSTKMVAMEMFASLSRVMRVPESEISMMLERLADGVRLGEMDEDEGAGDESG